MLKLALICVICNLVVWYDYILYGMIARDLAEFIFSETASEIAFLYSMATFAIGFFSRPLGSLFFGYIGDKYGRKVSLIASVGAMSVLSMMMVLLPGYRSVGYYAPIILVALRLLQGFVAGGEASVAVFFFEIAAPGRKVLFSSFEVFSAMLASLVCYFVLFLLKQFYVGGSFFPAWKVAFLVAVPLGVVSLYLRLKSEESSEFLRNYAAGALERNPVSAMFSGWWKTLLRVLGVDAFGNVIFYLFFTFLPAYFGHSSYLSIFSSILACFLTITCAFYADKLNPYRMLRFANIVCFVCAPIVFYSMFSSNIVMQSFSYIFVCVLVAIYSGSSNFVILNAFAPTVRYSGYGFSRNVSSAVFGGTAPFVISFLVTFTSPMTGPVFFLMACAALSFYVVRWLESRALPSK